MLLLEDQPSVQNSRLEALAAKEIVHRTPCLLGFSRPPVFQALAVELHRTLEKSKSEATHESVASILLSREIIDSIAPAAH